MLLLFRCGEDKFGVAPSAVIRRSEITSGLVCVTPAYIRLQAEAFTSRPAIPHPIIYLCKHRKRKHHSISEESLLEINHISTPFKQISICSRSPQAENVIFLLSSSRHLSISHCAACLNIKLQTETWSSRKIITMIFAFPKETQVLAEKRKFSGELLLKLQSEI